MNMRRSGDLPAFIIILTITGALLSNCDFEKYFTANLGMRENMDSTSYYGTVLREYDSEPVKFARLQLSFYHTYSDSSGKFELPILYEQDHYRNLIEFLQVTANNYENHSQTIYVYPVPTELNIELIWLPPVIHKNAMIIDLIDTNNVDLGGPKYCQAIIKDFQGINTVDSVTLRMTYEKDFVYWKMYQIATEDEFTGHYQSEIIYGGHDIGHAVLYYTLIVSDSDGNFSERVFVSYLRITEEPIF